MRCRRKRETDSSACRHTGTGRSCRTTPVGSSRSYRPRIPRRRRSVARSRHNGGCSSAYRRNRRRRDGYQRGTSSSRGRTSRRCKSGRSCRSCRTPRSSRCSPWYRRTRCRTSSIRCDRRRLRRRTPHYPRTAARNRRNCRNRFGFRCRFRRRPSPQPDTCTCRRRTRASHRYTSSRKRRSVAGPCSYRCMCRRTSCRSRRCRHPTRTSARWYTLSCTCRRPPDRRSDRGTSRRS